MSHKRNEALRHVQHSMHHVIAAGEGSDRAPDSCKLCPYYRPDFKFRTCLYICFVLKCLAENSNPIRNMKQYLLASLYNAPTTMQLSYQNQTNHDLANRR